MSTSSDPVADLYTQVLDLLGVNNAVILPIGDFDVDGSDAAFTTRGSRQLAFTWSEPLVDFDTPASTQGIVPVVTFNGIDEEADTPDDDF